MMPFKFLRSGSGRGNEADFPGPRPVASLLRQLPPTAVSGAVGTALIKVCEIP